MVEKVKHSKRYTYFLSLVVLLVVTWQVIIHISLNNQELAGSEIGIAGRQETLIQEISKIVQEIRTRKDEQKNVHKQIVNLETAFQKWNGAQKGLLNGSALYNLDGENSEEVDALFEKVSPTFVTLSKEIKIIIHTGEESDINIHIDNILNQEEEYVGVMNEIIFQYISENNSKMVQVRTISWILAFITIVVLFLSFRIIIKPLFQRLTMQNDELTELNSNLEKTNQVKSDFLANMSHEIRTPLNGIIGMTNFLKKSPLNEDQSDYVNTIHRSSENLLVIINDILDYSKIEAGKLELSNEVFNLTEVIEDIIDLLKPSAHQKNIELMYYMEPNVPVDLKMDSFRLRQVLINLLNNAIKFTENGEVVLKIINIHTEQNLVQLKFDIRDTGIGIDQDQVNYLFESFTQADSSTTRKYGGTGLGLAICRNIVEIMRGRIWVESEKGKGSTFHFTVIAELADESTQQLMLDTENLKGVKALVVDDNMTNLKILVKQLSNWGIQATPFNSPLLVMEIIDTLDKFELCILDMQMPEMDGELLTKKIREKYSIDQLPIIVLSSLGKSLLQDDDGFYSSYLTKPVKHTKLLTSINKVLGVDERKLALEESGVIGLDSVYQLDNKLKILIADDNEINRAVTEKTLQILGFKSAKASNGKQVLEKLLKTPYDLILMDVQMPVMDGLEASRKIKAMYEREEAPVIIGLTGNTSGNDKQECLKNGMDDFISKPLDSDDLSQKIHHWFPGS